MTFVGPWGIKRDVVTCAGGDDYYVNTQPNLSEEQKIGQRRVGNNFFVDASSFGCYTDVFVHIIWTLVWTRQLVVY